MTDSTKTYAPDFGDLTIFMAFVNLFELVCKLATVFFAMTYLFNFFMNCHSLQDRIEFFNL